MDIIEKNNSDLNNSMSFTEHLEELRQRLLNSIYAILISIFFSLLIIKPLISFLEIPASDIPVSYTHLTLPTT